VLDSLQRVGIDAEVVGTQLQDEGVRLFDEAFAALLAALD
jgi:hypothetical protein